MIRSINIDQAIPNVDADPFHRTPNAHRMLEQFFVGKVRNIIEFRGSVIKIDLTMGKSPLQGLCCIAVKELGSRHNSSDRKKRVPDDPQKEF